MAEPVQCPKCGGEARLYPPRPGLGAYIGCQELRCLANTRMPSDDRNRATRAQKGKP